MNACLICRKRADKCDCQRGYLGEWGNHAAAGADLDWKCAVVGTGLVLGVAAVLAALGLVLRWVVLVLGR